MDIVEIPLESIKAPASNPNEMRQDMRTHLRCSIDRFGMVVPLVVRPIKGALYETVGGAQRLAMLSEIGVVTAPCVVVAVDDAEAMLLGQALNHIAGRDNLGLRAKVLRELLESLPQQEILDLLPETSESLKELTNLGEQSIAQALQQWEQMQKARLHHMAFQLTDGQLTVVEEAFEHLVPLTDLERENPNRCGNALYFLCLDYLEQEHREVGTTTQEQQT